MMQGDNCGPDSHTVSAAIVLPALLRVQHVQAAIPGSGICLPSQEVKQKTLMRVPMTSASFSERRAGQECRTGFRDTTRFINDTRENMDLHVGWKIVAINTAGWMVHSARHCGSPIASEYIVRR